SGANIQNDAAAGLGNWTIQPSQSTLHNGVYIVLYGVRICSLVSVTPGKKKGAVMYLRISTTRRCQCGEHGSAVGSIGHVGRVLYQGSNLRLLQVATAADATHMKKPRLTILQSSGEQRGPKITV